MEPNGHRELVRSSFAQQAQSFDDRQLTLSNDQYIHWILRRIPLDPTKTALDFACGTGIMARAIAPRVQHVIAVDLSAEMIARGRLLADAAGLTNIEFRECSADAIDVAAESCDLAITRLSLHHFSVPAVPIRTMAEAVTRGGHVAVVDLLSPPDPGLAERYNHYECLRDPSHTRALTSDELVSLVRQSGLDVVETDTLGVEVNVDRWLRLTNTPEPVAGQIIRDLEQEVAQGPATGLFPFAGPDGRLMFRQTWGFLLALKR